MNRDTKIILKNTFLAVAAVVTTVGLLRIPSDDADAGILGILLWAIGPYIVFWLVTFLLERFSSVRQVPGIGFGISIFIALYALAVYLQPLNHKSSTEGLIYIFAPLWLYFLTLPVLAICILVAWLSNRQQKNPDDH